MKKNSETGQVLVSLLLFVLAATIIISGAVVITVINSQTTSGFVSGEEAFEAAESGIDNALVRLLRDSSYSGEVVSIGSGTATINVSGGSTKTIISEGVVGNAHRKIQVIVNLANDSFSQVSWNEIN